MWEGGGDVGLGVGRSGLRVVTSHTFHLANMKGRVRESIIYFIEALP